MATKTTKAPAVQAKQAKGSKGVDALAKAREARERAAGEDIFRPGSGPKEGAKKLAPQAAQIVAIVESHKKAGVTRESLIAEMQGAVQTKQPLSRILGYYQKALVEGGYVTLTEAPKKEKPVKAAKEEAAEDEGSEESE